MDLILAPDVFKQLKKIVKKDQVKVERKLLQLVDNPYLGKPLHGKFKHFRGLKVWPLRVIYRVDIKRKVVEILDVDYRGGVYKK
jgi:addiction module RelE/StbE family toxin